LSQDEILKIWTWSLPVPDILNQKLEMN
jgi:hypothetical protein